MSGAGTSQPQPALAGMRVVELGREANYAVPYAAKLLADMGADVVLVEDGAGHDLRRGHPGMPANRDVSTAIFAFLAERKRSFVPDDGEAGARQLGQLVASADIVIAPLGQAGLAEHLRPGAALITISPWGNSGPYRDRPATPLTLQAAAGWVTSRKDPGLWPVQVGGHMHEWACGSYIATAALTALREARHEKLAVTCDIGLFECLHSMLCYDKLRYDARGELGVSRDRILLAPLGTRPCKDGWVGINTLTEAQWADACRMLGLEEYSGQMQAMNRGEGDLAELGRKLEAFLADKTINEMVDLGQRMRIPVVPVADGNSLCDFPQWQQRRFFAERVVEGRSYRQPGPPWRFYGSPTPQAMEDSPAGAIGAGEVGA